MSLARSQVDLLHLVLSPSGLRQSRPALVNSQRFAA